LINNFLGVCAINSCNLSYMVWSAKVVLDICHRRCHK
jgi:hypothetical protein